VALRSAASTALIALAFVLVYKATEVVNFAQGDLMMLGGFFAFTFIGLLGLNYWIGFAAAVAAMALFGMLAERLVVRRFSAIRNSPSSWRPSGSAISCALWSA
jgi:branched-subunit amino acid ABC-type transport system permease component